MKGTEADGVHGDRHCSVWPNHDALIRAHERECPDDNIPLRELPTRRSDFQLERAGFILHPGDIPRYKGGLIWPQPRHHVVLGPCARHMLVNQLSAPPDFEIIRPHEKAVPLRPFDLWKSKVWWQLFQFSHGDVLARLEAGPKHSAHFLNCEIRIRWSSCIYTARILIRDGEHICVQTFYKIRLGGCPCGVPHPPCARKAHSNQRLLPLPPLPVRNYLLVSVLVLQYCSLRWRNWSWIRNRSWGGVRFCGCGGAGRI
mmetsp:Transcript_68/g.142  ORF Transcript_68/g.142 Transcript_68/m.142 type:complete len:257 (-) Transcript_68:392-1162(-)